MAPVEGAPDGANVSPGLVGGNVKGGSVLEGLFGLDGFAEGANVSPGLVGGSETAGFDGAKVSPGLVGRNVPDGDAIGVGEFVGMAVTSAGSSITCPLASILVIFPISLRS